MNQTARILNERTWTATTEGNKAHGGLQQIAQEPFIAKWFLPHQETQVLSASTSRGLFIPYPLLAVLVLIAGAVLSFVVAVQVQVSNLNTQVANLNTTLLMRDADARGQIAELKAKNAQLEVYIHDDREKLVSIQTKLGIRRN